MTYASTTALKWCLDGGSLIKPLPIRENQHARILWDVPIPTDKRTRRLDLIEMAVAWDSLQMERRAEKLSKYGELCANLRGQFPGYRLDSGPALLLLDKEQLGIHVLCVRVCVGGGVA